MNVYLLIILLALVGEYLLSGLTRYLNLRALDPELPEEFKGYYDPAEYRRSQEYTRAYARFSYVSSTFNLAAILAFILLGGFNYLDLWVRSFDWPTIPTGLLFFGALYLLQDIISIPFDLYETFVIEERFGFNRMSWRTFVLDRLKSYGLFVILGSTVLGGVLFFFERMGEYAWLYAWGLMTIFIVVAQPLFTAFIAPLFNRFEPLEDGELKEAIEDYSEQVQFPVKDISVMDGSRRSAHSNAYFSGLGKKKRIALFDTLIAKHTTSELVAVIAHEVGHYVKKHTRKGMILSILHMGILLFLLSLFIHHDGLFEAFQMEHESVYAGLVFFALLYTPIELILSVGVHALSRRYEYEADAFAAETIGSPEPLVVGLKKLSVSNLGNLTPHPLAVLLNYSHPPVLKRIRALRTVRP